MNNITYNNNSAKIGLNDYSENDCIYGEFKDKILK